jgi:preprotein translocase subunit SecG
MRETILNITQIALSSVLILIIALQQKGSGMGALLGGSSNVYSTKRGLDKVLHITTIVIAAVFLAVSLARVFF